MSTTTIAFQFASLVLSSQTDLLLTKAVARRSTASKVRADVKVVSLLVLASFLISTYALTM